MEGPVARRPGGRFSLRDGDRIGHGMSWHPVHNEPQLGKALKQVKDAGLLAEEQGRLCVGCEGASWIWQHVQALCPHARQLRDSDHCAADLHGGWPRHTTAQPDRAERGVKRR